MSATAYFTIEQAAPLLQLTDEALRARCRRAARKVGRDIMAQLADGIVGVKFGRSWRIRFPEPAAYQPLSEPRALKSGGC